MDPINNPELEVSGTIKFDGIVYTFVWIDLKDKGFDNTQWHLTWKGPAVCWGGGINVPVHGWWSRNPEKAGKTMTVMVGGGGVLAGGAKVVMSKDNQKFGQFVALGLDLGACVLKEDFDITTKASISNRNTSRRYKGSSSTDMFMFNKRLKYGEEKAPVIKNFNADQRDHLYFGGKSAKTLPTMDELNFKVVKTDRQLEKASEKGFDFIYHQPQGHLYHDLNSDQEGFGSGGLMAIFIGGPDLNSQLVNVAS